MDIKQLLQDLAVGFAGGFTGQDLSSLSSQQWRKLGLTKEEFEKLKREQEMIRELDIKGKKQDQASQSQEDAANLAAFMKDSGGLGPQEQGLTEVSSDWRPGVSTGGKGLMTGTQVAGETQSKERELTDMINKSLSAWREYQMGAPKREAAVDAREVEQEAARDKRELEQEIARENRAVARQVTLQQKAAGNKEIDLYKELHKEATKEYLAMTKKESGYAQFDPQISRDSWVNMRIQGKLTMMKKGLEEMASGGEVSPSAGAEAPPPGTAETPPPGQSSGGLQLGVSPEQQLGTPGQVPGQAPEPHPGQQRTLEQVFDDYGLTELAETDPAQADEQACQQLFADKIPYELWPPELQQYGDEKLQLQQ